MNAEVTRRFFYVKYTKGNNGYGVGVIMGNLMGKMGFVYIKPPHVCKQGEMVYKRKAPAPIITQEQSSFR